MIDNPAQSNPEWAGDKPETNSSSAPYKLYNIGNNAPVNLMEFISEIEVSIGKVAKKNFMEMQDGDVESTYADTSGLIEDFNYKPFTPLSEGVNEFVIWYKDFYNKG